MNYFDSDMSKSANKVVHFARKNYIYVWTMSHKIYAAKFEQTITHQHILLRLESQSHVPLGWEIQSY